MQQILEKIEYKRKQMIERASQKGFKSEDVIALSQEVDELLNEYERKKSQV